ncbi:MAG: glycosyltransferase [Verrucomicrobiae bacterium]|nr:glycosyltransferase [Verrucomicrobiae bacterium]
MPLSEQQPRIILWWGRGDNQYSRNRIIRQLLANLGYQICDFRPRVSFLGDWEAAVRVAVRPSLVWVPCFRQRDMSAAARWSRRRHIRVVFDPLISAFDKQVNERTKFSASSRQARRLLKWEQRRFLLADLLVADTASHAAYFCQRFDVSPRKTAVVMVGAEEGLFRAQPLALRPDCEPLEVLYYGSFIHLQAPEVIVEAAKHYRGPPVQWTLLGNGPLRARCESSASGLPTVRFEPWISYDSLPARIHRADVLLGVFGGGEKAGRVIPNKVFQALACGRPVVTRHADAYPDALRKGGDHGIFWVQPGDPKALAKTVADLAARRARLPTVAEQAAKTFQEFFSYRVIQQQLREALDRVFTSPTRL